MRTIGAVVARVMREVGDEDNPDARLFPKNKLGRGSNNLTPEGLNSLLKRIAKRAGLKKSITTYIFRHSRLTELANVL